MISVPSEAIRPVLSEIKPLLHNHPIFVNTAKGFDVKTKKRLSEVYREVLGKKMSALVSLIGPSLSIEVARHQLTCICAVSTDEEASKVVAQTFSNYYFRVYTTTDEIGAEIGVAIKNPIAICSGILKGLGYGDNARAALMTRGLHDDAKVVGTERDVKAFAPIFAHVFAKVLLNHPKGNAIAFDFGVGDTGEIGDNPADFGFGFHVTLKSREDLFDALIGG